MRKDAYASRDLRAIFILLPSVHKCVRIINVLIFLIKSHSQ